MTDIYNVTPKDIYDKLKSDADQAYRMYQYQPDANHWEDFCRLEVLCADFAAKHEDEIYG